jgi:hypothetical protein
MSFLDRVFANFDEQEALEDYARAEREMHDANTGLKAAVEKAEKARHDFIVIEETVDAWERWSGRKIRATAEAEHQANGGGTGGRAAIRELLRQHSPDKEWTIPTVADAMGLAKEHHHAIQVHLGRMARDGELQRPRKGVYRLPSADHGSAGEGENQGLRRATG